MTVSSGLPRLAGGDLSKAETVELYQLAASLSNPSSIHARVYDWWREFDQEFFGGQLSPCLIVIGITEHSACLGQCAAIGGQARITLHQGVVWPSVANQSDTRWGLPTEWMGEALLRDCLLHEMQHQAQAELRLDTHRVTGVGRDAHHCRSWSDLCNASAPKLGLAETWFPIFKRTKVAVTGGDGEVRRINQWVIANADEKPAGSRTAEFADVSQFPFRTFQRLGLAEERYRQ
jgi:hypothetical protein